MISTKTEQAKADDCNELLNFLHSVFLRNDPQHPRFEKLYPELFESTDESMGNHTIIRKDSRIVSCIGAYPMKMKIAGCDVHVAGIGQVSTAVDMLGMGFMSTILKAVTKRMENSGIAVAWLGGRRDRYSRFGWDVCGCNFTAYIDGGTVKEIDGAFDIRRYSSGEFHVTDKLLEIANPVLHMIDDAKTYNRRLSRSKAEVWEATEPQTGKTLGWITVYNDCKLVVDVHAPTSVATALVRTAARYYKSITITTPGVQCGFTEAMRAICQHAWCATSTLMVVSLTQTLKDYAPFFKDRIPNGFGVTLEMERQDEEIETVDIGCGGEKLRLDRPRMARMFFGPERATNIPGVPKHLTALDSIFPLPFLLPEIYHV